jgi:excisionase family DNA binding protein
MPTTTRATLTMKEVARMVGFDRHTISRMAKEGRFPKPFRPGKRKYYWPAAAIERWLLAGGRMS